MRAFSVTPTTSATSYLRFYGENQFVPSGRPFVLGGDLLLNPLVVPPYMSARFWKEIVAKTFCEAHGLTTRRLHNVLASQIDVLYEHHGVYKERKNSQGLNLLYLYDKLHTRVLTTSHEPAFKEALLLASLLEPVKNPKVKRMFATSTPNDEESIVSRVGREELGVIGQPHIKSYNLWAFLLILNKVFEQRRLHRRNGRLNDTLVVSFDEGVLTEASFSTLKYVEEHANEVRIRIEVLKRSRDTD